MNVNNTVRPKTNTPVFFDFFNNSNREMSEEERKLEDWKRKTNRLAASELLERAAREANARRFAN